MKQVTLFGEKVLSQREKEIEEHKRCEHSIFLVSLLRNKKLSITGQNKRERLPPKANKGHKVHPKYLSLYPSLGKLEALIDTGLYTPKGKLQLSQLKLQIQSLKDRMFSTLFSYISQYPSYHINIFVEECNEKYGIKNHVYS